MADNRTMAQMLQAPIEGYEDAIVVPPINANNFELKQPLINLVQKYSQEVLDFPTQIAYGNPSPGYDPIVSNSSPTLTPFEDSDFLLLEEADTFLAIADDLTSPKVDEAYYDPEGNFLLLRISSQ
ncbi:hypothetical protein Tco_0607738 [Tanacetum coccineum]